MTTFGDPPPVEGNATRHPEFWQALRDNPGDWGQYPGPGESVYNLCAKRGPDWEATTRTIQGVRVGWCRYIGETWCRYIGETPDGE